MAIVVRCVVGIYSNAKLLDRARGLEINVDVAGIREPYGLLRPPCQRDLQAQGHNSALDLLP